VKSAEARAGQRVEAAWLKSDIFDTDPSVLMFPGGMHPLIRDFQSM